MSSDEKKPPTPKPARPLPTPDHKKSEWTRDQGIGRKDSNTVNNFEPPPRPERRPPPSDKGGDKKE